MTIVWTYDWVPEGPRGYVRDIRLRWALEEASLLYTVRSVPFEGRGPEHVARQPFAQAPFLEDGGITVFESGACLLHLGEKSEVLMPRDPQGEADTLQWVIAALNSIEMITVPWWFVGMSRPDENPLEGLMRQRLEQLEAVIVEREWLAASRFTIADILMADVLRVPKVRAFADFPAIHDYVDRACARPAFKKAYADQIVHFAASDRQREERLQ